MKRNENQSFLSEVFGMTRTARLASVSAGILLLAFVLLIVLNALTGLLPASCLSLNLSGSDTFVLSRSARNELSDLGEPVSLTYFAKGGRASADRDLVYFFSQFGEASEKISFEIVDPDSADALLLVPAGTEIESNSILVRSEKRYKTVSFDELYYYFNPNVGTNLSAAEYEYYVSSFLTAYQTTGQVNQNSVGYVLYSTSDETEIHFDGASKIVNAIRFVTAPKVPRVTVVGPSGLDVSLTETLTLNCFEVTEQLTLENLPEDTALLFLYAPASDLSEAEEAVLRGFLTNGGKLILSTLYTSISLPRLSAVLADFGLSFEPTMHFLCEGNPNYLLSQNYPYYILCHMDSAFAASANMTDPFVALMAHRIVIADTLPEGVTVTPILYTSAAGYYYYQNGSGTAVSDDRAVYNLGVYAAKGDCELFWLSSPLSITAQGNSLSENANYTFFLSLCNELCDTEAQSVVLDSTQIRTEQVNVSAVTVLIFAVLLVLVIPGAVLAAGIVYRAVRKRR